MRFTVGVVLPRTYMSIYFSVFDNDTLGFLLYHISRVSTRSSQQQ